jgi:hypothetical protein
MLSDVKLRASVLVMVLMVFACATAWAAEPSSTFDKGTAEKAEGKDKVLRHAVFFKFKDSATKGDVKSVVDAFRALPGKIAEIKELQSGESIEGSGHNDGLTHCFLLTFDDEAGRAAYLPHPDHKAFGGVLRPHLEKVFVIDYWGMPQRERSKKELKHAVFVKFKEDASEADVKAVEDGLAELPAKIDVIKAFEWGKNNSPETHDESFTHCFMFTFESEKALKDYADHPDHVAIAKFLLPKLEKLRVIDFYGDVAPVAGSTN